MRAAVVADKQRNAGPCAGLDQRIGRRACTQFVIAQRQHQRPVHDQAAEGEAVSGLSLKSYADLMQGTRYGKVVVPGSPESSALYLTVAQETSPEIQMPPHHEDKLAMGSGAALTEKKALGRFCRVSRLSRMKSCTAAWCFP